MWQNDGTINSVTLFILIAILALITILCQMSKCQCQK